MAAEFPYDRRKTMSGKGSLRLWQSRDGLGLGPRVLGQISGKKRGHGGSVFAHLLNRAGKPLVNRAIHQAICKKEHNDDREEREQQTSDHQPSSELGAQDAEPSLRKQLQQIAGQHKCEGYEKEKNYGGKGRKEQELLVRIRIQKRKIERRLRKQDSKQDKDANRQQNDDFLPAGRFLVAAWIWSRQVSGRTCR